MSEKRVPRKESHVLEVVETMRLGISCAAGAPIYDDCFLLWQDFEAIFIEHCFREANKVAHEIARVALSLKDNCIWVDQPLNVLFETMVTDVIMFDNQSITLRHT
jgi:hypothetical protein